MKIDGIKIPGLKQDLKQLQQQQTVAAPTTPQLPTDGLAGSVQPSGLMPSSFPTKSDKHDHAAPPDAFVTPLPASPAAPPAAFVTPQPASAAAAPTATGGATYPARIVILRHGEKPDGDTPGQDPAGLTPQGEARAQALATVLPQDYPHIDYIFAAANSKNSHRPVDTITPTAEKLGLPVNTTFADKDWAQVAQTLEHDPKYAGKTVVIDWHHGEIPALTQALGATPPETKWPGSQFDRMWEVDFNQAGKATVQDLPEKALPGDSQT